MSLSRRDALGAIAAAGAASLIDPGPLLATLAAEQPCTASDEAGTLLGTVPLFRSDGQVQPFGVKLGGRGNDARLVTDLSTLDRTRVITPNRLAFIRTEGPPVRGARKPWTVSVGGSGANQSIVTVRDLTRRSRAMGAHLLECSGNNNPANFGLMSVSEWDGVLLTDVLRGLGRSPADQGVLVSGADPDSKTEDSGDSTASWIFPLDLLDRLGAFLAVRMNGVPLSVDHGAPVRLIVPGWYGCTWIKWVNEIRLTGADHPATSQMKEFAGRTHQTARHDLARDYTPADIQAAAMPIRVEKRRTSTGPYFRVVGIVWGGTKPIDRLAIRFANDDPWKSFSVCPVPTTQRVWSLWDYAWKPGAPGVYDITLRVPDPAVPQRRLDSGYYRRQIRI